MAKQPINFTKVINNVETALSALDAVENIVQNVQTIISNQRKELDYTLTVIKEAQGDVGARPRSSKVNNKIKPLSKEKQAEVLASFFKKKSPAVTGLPQYQKRHRYD